MSILQTKVSSRHLQDSYSLVSFEYNLLPFQVGYWSQHLASFLLELMYLSDGFLHQPFSIKKIPRFQIPPLVCPWKDCWSYQLFSFVLLLTTIYQFLIALPSAEELSCLFLTTQLGHPFSSKLLVPFATFEHQYLFTFIIQFHLIQLIVLPFMLLNP